MKNIIPNLFFLFLTSPVLSPSVFGMTIYLSAIIIFFDIYFYNWLQKNLSWGNLKVVIFCVLVMLVVCHSPTLIVKIIMLLASATYGYYCYMTNKFFLYRWIVFNVIIAIVQFALIFIDFEKAILIGPENIAKQLWGSFATPANTNFFAISLLPRVSGLSREGGFFAALLGVSLFTLLYDKYTKGKRFYLFMIILGLLVSTSKSSLIILLIPLVVSLKRYVNLLGPLVVSACYSIVLTLVCIYLNSHTNFFADIVNVTFTHRFSGYLYAPYLELKDFFTGITLKDLLVRSDNFPTEIKEYLVTANLDFCGLPAIYLNYGIQGFIVFMITLKALNFDALSFLLIIVFTTNVSPLTSDGFVILAWILATIISRGNSTISKGPDYSLTF